MVFAYFYMIEKTKEVLVVPFLDSGFLFSRKAEKRCEALCNQLFCRFNAAGVEEGSSKSCFFFVRGKRIE